MTFAYRGVYLKNAHLLKLRLEPPLFDVETDCGLMKSPVEEGWTPWVLKAGQRDGHENYAGYWPPLGQLNSIANVFRRIEALHTLVGWSHLSSPK